MPRIGRTSVKFTVDDVAYVAVFSHKHAERVERHIHTKVYDSRIVSGGKLTIERQIVKTLRLEEKPLKVAGTKGTIKVKHITTCLLRRDGNTVAEGKANCSVKEPAYRWQKGIAVSFEKALDTLGITVKDEPLRRKRFMTALFNELFVREPESTTEAEAVAAS